MHTRSLSRAIAFAIAAPAALWLGCGGGADLTGPPAGSLQVTVATTGAEPDPDGYAVSLDGGTARAVGVNETLLLEGLSAGTHALDLSGLAANCSPTGGSHVDVEVTANATAAASFAIACGATSGAVSVRTVTTGEPADPDGYELTLDGGAPQPIGSAATLTLPSVAPGAHSLALGGLASNCAVSSDNPVGVTVSAGSTSEVTIDVTCAPTSPPPAPGSLSVTTRTTGPDQDADGYSVTLDGDPGLPIGVSASLAVSDLAPGAHMVGLTGISANCRLDGDNPRIVEVASGTVTPVTFAITCAALPPSIGSLELTTATTGATPDPDGYTFEIDNGDPQPIGVNATVTVASLAAGSHAVRLRGASANCTIAGDNPRGVTVEAGGVARLTFSIACAAATGSLRITTTSSGAPADPDGYTVSVDGGAPQPIGNAATLTIDGLEPRAHSVQLAGLAANCQAQGGNPRSVSVAPGETAATTFSVTCSATTGTLEITVTGLPAGASAAVGVTGPDKFSTAVTGTTSLDDLAPGSYTVTSNDVSANGTTYSATPASQTLTVAANATSRVTVTYGALAGRTLNLRIDGVELTQSVQQPGGTVPLVADRDGFLRVFVLANETNTAAPSVRVRLSRDGRVVQTLTITAPRGSTPTARDEGDLNASWNVKIPRSMFTAGLAIQAEVDPDNSVAESNESDNAFPASGAARQTVRSVPEFALRFVPVRQQVSGAQGAISEGTRADFLRLTRRMYPIASVDGDVHAVYTTSTTDALQSDDANDAWTTILNEVDALRVAEGTSRTYYGVVHIDYLSGVAGLGSLGRPTAIGYDREVDQARVMAHELGHTWLRLHSPCGLPAGADPDPDYPYAGGVTGVYGFDLQDNVLRSPSSPDVMGYCADPWISDYTYEGVLDYRIAAQAALARAALAPVQPCLLVWGRIVDGRPVLEPAFEVITRPSLPQGAGPFRVEGRAADGAPLFALSFDAAEVADAPRRSRHFAFAVPLDGAAAGRLASLRLDTPAGEVASQRLAPPLAAAGAQAGVEARAVAGGAQLRWDATAHPMVMVRDPATGEILSFARGGVVDLPTAQRALDVVLSDRVGSRSVRVAVAGR